MKFLSKDLVTHDYRDALQKDLAQATVCRFLIAYVSSEGIKSIHRAPLLRALKDSRSFGVASLSCACKYEPLLNLQDELSEIRLKYFMDPVVEEKDEPKNIALFHSKLVYIYNKRTQKSIVYLGSHNWTRRALGPQGPRNAEASLRLEFDFEEEHLLGNGDSVPSEVNQHLLHAWNAPLCFPATRMYETRFEEWTAKVCRRADSVSLEQNVVVLAVRTGQGNPDWLSLTGESIYFQILSEEEGDLIRTKSNNSLMLLVWESSTDLSNGAQPIIIRGQITDSNAGPQSSVAGNNTATSPMSGFNAVVFDSDELSSYHQNRRIRTPPRTLWSGRDISAYEFEFPTPHHDCAAVDGVVDPKYRFLLKVESVCLPSNRLSESINIDERAEYAWTPDSFTVAKKKSDLRLEESPGYRVDAEQKRDISDYLREVLLVDVEKAKALPYSGEDDAKSGKRIAKHPLHETFLRTQLIDRSDRDSYYRSAKQGTLSAELDLFDVGGTDEPIDRLQRVYTAPVNDLLDEWRNRATSLKRLRKSEDARDD